MPQQTNPRTWVTKAEMAKHLNCTPRYINVLMRRRILPYVKTRGLLRFDLADCDRALQLFKTRSLADPTQQPAVPQARPRPAPAAPPPTPLAPEAAALPDDQATPLVRFEMFTSLIQMRTFLDTLENGTAERRGPDVDDRNADRKSVV